MKSFVIFLMMLLINSDVLSQRSAFFGLEVRNNALYPIGSEVKASTDQTHFALGDTIRLRIRTEDYTGVVVVKEIEYDASAGVKEKKRTSIIDSDSIGYYHVDFTECSSSNIVNCQLKISPYDNGLFVFYDKQEAPIERSAKFLPTTEDFNGVDAGYNAQSSQVGMQKRVEQWAIDLPRRSFLLVYDATKKTVHSIEKSKRWGRRRSPAAHIRGSASFVVVNVNPFRYTVATDHEVIDVVSEVDEGAQGVFGKQQGSTDTDEPDTATVSHSTGGSLSLLAQLEEGSRLEAEMEAFYERKSLEAVIDVDLLNAEFQIIDRRIAKHFQLSVFSTLAVEKKSSEWLNGLAETERQQGEDYARKITSGLQKLSSMKSLPYEIWTLPVQAGNHDVLRFTMQIGEQGKPTVKRTYDVNLFGGFKADFSSGLIFTGLHDAAYVLRTEMPANTNLSGGGASALPDTAAVNRIESQKTGTFDVGLGVMGHFYWRTAWFMTPAISLGAMTTSNSDIRYFGGVSLMFGQEQRLVLSAGIAAGAVNRLAAPYALGDPFVGPGPVPTVSVNKMKGFLGITYNLKARNTDVVKPDQCDCE